MAWHRPGNKAIIRVISFNDGQFADAYTFIYVSLSLNELNN